MSDCASFHEAREKDRGEPTDQRPERRDGKIRNRRVPARRKVLEVLKAASVYPK
jgi:hypothetical protein